MRLRFAYLAVMALASWQVMAQETYHAPIYSQLDSSSAFPFGVASGDPSTESVIIWTKLLPQTAGSFEVGWKISTDTSMQEILQQGFIKVSADNGYTIKQKIVNLPEGKTLFYQFNLGRRLSPIGRTNTIAAEPEEIRLAVVSCSDFQTGHFNAYAHIAMRNDIDAVVHLGDYIYETSAQRWGPRKQRKQMYRHHVPAHVLITLKDYRTRYAQYRLDPGLREAHRLHPFIVVWDDHEFSNNAHSEMASPAQLVRRKAARKAYFEWLPITDNEQDRLYRKIGLGNMADLWMLDTRQEARMEQAEDDFDPRWRDSSRTMLGIAQREWLLDGMAKSKARWQILGNQVIFTPLHDSRVFSRVPAIKMDRWDGYPAAQQHLFSQWRQNNIENIIVVTGDVHTAWAFDLTEKPRDPSWYYRKEQKGVIGAEFVTPSVSAFNFNNILPRPLAWEAERRLKKNKYNPHLKYLDLNRHGYLTISLNNEQTMAEWIYFNPKKSSTKIQQSRSVSYKYQPKS